MAFLEKSPCRRACALDIRDCPPSGKFHNIKDYPVYYDPLYHPLDYPSLFETPDTVCVWLLLALQAHPAQCYSCSRARFHGHVSYADNVFEIHVVASHSVSLGKQALESASYHHCHIFRMIDEILSKTNDNSVAQCFCRVVEDDPPWLFYSDEHYENALSALSVPVLCEAGQKIVSLSKHEWTKPSLISTILRHFAHQCATIITLALPELLAHLGSLLERLPVKPLGLSRVP